MTTSENQIAYKKTGGHNHDGVGSTKIDFSKYTDAELAPITSKIESIINEKIADLRPGDDSGTGPEFPSITIGDRYITDIVPDPVSLVLTTGRSFTNYEFVWIEASWELPLESANQSTDDDGSTLVFYKEGSDDTDEATLIEDNTAYLDQVTDYEVRLIEDGAFIRAIRTQEKQVRFEPVMPGVEYTIEVRALNVLGMPSDVLSGTIVAAGDLTPPVAVTGLSARFTYRGAMLTWDESPEDDVKNGRGQYQIEVDVVDTFDSVNKYSVYANSTLAYIGDLTTGQQYYMRIRAIDSSLNEGPWSSAVGGVPGTIGGGDLGDGSPPPAVGTPTLEAGFRNLVAKWDAVTNDDPVTYDVYLGTTAGFTPDASSFLGSTAATYFNIIVDANNQLLSYDTNYYVKIVAKDADGSAAASVASAAKQVGKVSDGDTDGSISTPLSDGNPPSSSPQPTITGGPNYILAKWDDVVNADPVIYDVHISTTSGFTPGPTNLVGSVSGTFMFITRDASDAALVYGTTYYVSLVARDADGSASAGLEGSGSMVQIDSDDIFEIDGSSVNISNLNANSITAGTIDASVITVSNLDASNITTGTLDASVISVSNLSADQITAGTFAAGVVYAGDISANQITTGTLDASTITVTNLSADQIAAGTLGADVIFGGTISAGSITSGTISAHTITLDSINSSIQSSTFQGVGSGLNTGFRIRGNGVAEFNNVTVRGHIEATSGSISTSLLVGTLVADSVASNWVYAGAINASQITAGTITGRTLQTASSGQRVVVSASGNEIGFYNSQGSYVGAIYGGFALPIATSLQINSFLEVVGTCDASDYTVNNSTVINGSRQFVGTGATSSGTANFSGGFQGGSGRSFINSISTTGMQIYNSSFGLGNLRLGGLYYQSLTNESSMESKENIVIRADYSKDINALKNTVVKEWNYIGDNTRRLGPIFEESPADLTSPDYEHGQTGIDIMNAFWTLWRVTQNINERLELLESGE